MVRETILVVDDDPQVARTLAHKLLPTMGYETLTAYNGKSALRMVKAHRPELMLLDLLLPDMGGLELMQHLAGTGDSLPTILMTAHGSEQIAVEAFRLGAQDYLIKPMDHESLKRAIDRALTETRLRREKTGLLERQRRQIAWLRALVKIGQSLTSTLNLDQLLHRVVEASVYLTRADEGFLALREAQSEALYLRAAKNLEKDQAETLRMPLNDSLVGQVFRTQHPVRLDAESRERQSLKISTGLLVKSLLHVPVTYKGRSLGVLSVDNRVTARSFTEMDEMLLKGLASYAAIAIGNAQLYEQAEEEIVERRQAQEHLKKLLEEKETLLQEVHHRVKNNLQVVSSLLNLQSGHVTDPRVDAALRDSQHRVRSMALVHERLYQSEDLVRIDFVDYVRSLSTYLCRSYGVDPETITLKMKAENVSLNIDTAIPCGLIINELVSNALKHAFPDDAPGRIRVALRASDDDQLTLTVADDGVGLPKDVDFLHPTSLGLQLVSTLVQQLEGSIDLERRGGTAIEITFSEQS